MAWLLLLLCTTIIVGKDTQVSTTQEPLTVPVSSLGDEPGQAADGSPGFTYFSEEAEDAAKNLQKLVVDLDVKVSIHIQDLSTSNAASQAITAYHDAQADVRGTKCNVDTSADYTTSVEEGRDIDADIKACVVFTPLGTREALRKAIVEAVAMIQAADDTLRLNAEVCFSTPAVTAPQGCQDTKNKALALIAASVSADQMTKFRNLFDSTLKTISSDIDSCVDKATKKLKLKAEASTKALLDCKSTL